MAAARLRALPAWAWAGPPEPTRTIWRRYYGLDGDRWTQSALAEVFGLKRHQANGPLLRQLLGDR